MYERRPKEDHKGDDQNYNKQKSKRREQDFNDIQLDYSWSIGSPGKSKFPINGVLLHEFFSPDYFTCFQPMWHQNHA